MTVVRAALVRERIDVPALLASVSHHGAGAVASFLGAVREVNAGRAVVGLEYQAYEPMAATELATIAGEASERWDGVRVAVEHRLGALALGDLAVAVVVSHPHRGPAFDACRHVIEELKLRLPVWKREQYADGVSEWVDPTGHLAPR